MKKQTFSYRTAPKLTQVVKSLMERNGYEKFTRPAQSGSGDDVHTIMNRKTGFCLEFCIKTHPTHGGNYVNWARVAGDEETVKRFCESVELQEAQAPSSTFTAKL